MQAVAINYHSHLSETDNVMFNMYMQQIAFNNNGKTITYICFYPRDTVLAVTQCLSVSLAGVLSKPSICLSLAGVLLKPLNAQSWLLAWRLPFTYHPTVCYEKIGESSELRIPVSQTLPQTVHLAKFNHYTTSTICQPCSTDGCYQFIALNAHLCSGVAIQVA